MEELPFRVDSSHTCLQPVAEHDEGIMVEQLRNRVEIVTIVLVEGIYHFYVVVLQFHKQQRQTIYETHDVSPSMIERTIHPHLTDTQEVILLRRSEVYHLSAYLFRLAVRLYTSHGHTILDVLILLLVDLHQRL